MTKDSIQNCLFGKLNDEIVNGFLFYMRHKLQDDVVIILTQWYLDARTNRNSKGRIRFENLLLASGNSDVVIPINKINNWCLVCIKNGVGVLYDSLEFQEADHEVIESVESVIQTKSWFHLQGRKQTSSIDCGVHMLATAWNFESNQRVRRVRLFANCDIGLHPTVQESKLIGIKPNLRFVNLRKQTV